MRRKVADKSTAGKSGICHQQEITRKDAGMFEDAGRKLSGMVKIPTVSGKGHEEEYHIEAYRKFLKKEFAEIKQELRELMNDAWIQSAAFKHPSFAREKERRLVISPFILNEFAVEPRYHVSAGRIKKYYPLDLNRMCGRLGLHMSELFGEIIIGPTSSQSIPILQDYLVDCGLNTLKNKISMSDCPLRKPTS